MFGLEAETAHEWVTRLTSAACTWEAGRRALKRCLAVSDPVELFGVRFPNRVGLAAGFDKHGRFVQAADALGFGHLEVGAVTPVGQVGNPRPRLFRIPEHQALRNRMGFNNEGAEAVAHRLERIKNRTIPLGINLGKNAETPLEAAADDYCATLARLHSLADFFVVNVSSPNTAGLRDLQQEEHLARILDKLNRTNLSLGQPKPLLLKISPDLDNPALEGITQMAPRYVQGLVATNTTLARVPPYHQVPPEGGLSGRPLSSRSVEVVRKLREHCKSDFPIIGVGGIHDGESVKDMVGAGANLVQVYTALVYEGPLLPRRLALAAAEAATGALKTTRNSNL